MPDAVTVSIIIPLYNTATFVSECIESVVSQNLEDIEILVVDDGSTDGGDDIVEKYRVRYPFIKLMRQSRKRQGAARNLALSVARGEFVSFLDSDDRLPPGALTAMVDVARCRNSDLVCGIQQSFSKRRKWAGVPVHNREFTRVVECTNIESMPSLIEDISACNRLLRKSFIDRTGLCFPEGTAGEDLDFMAHAYLNAECISILPEIVYEYRARDGSRTSRISPRFFEDRVSVIKSLESFFAEKNFFYVYKKLIRSELRKLTGARLARVIKNSRYEEQLQVFDLLHSLAAKLHHEEFYLKEDFDLKRQIRIILLATKEYDALLAYENSPHSPRFIYLVRAMETRAKLFEPMMLEKYEGIDRFEKVAQLPNSRLYKYANRFLLLSVSVIRMLRRVKAIPMLKYFAVAPIAALRKKVLPTKGDIWLMDERVCSSAEDNGYFFFKYVREQYPEHPLFYVIDKSSPHYSKVAFLGHVIPRNSFQHVWLLCLSRVLLSTDSLRGLAFPFELFPRLYRNKLNIFLQHGVAGNKTMNYNRENYPYFNKVVITNRIEQAFFKKPYYNFHPDQLILTGIARFDNLPAQPPRNISRKILLAPTWRRWLRGQDAIRSSRYYHAWNTLIKSPELASMLDEFDAELYFRPHFNMMHFIDEFESSSDRIKILRNTNEPLHQLIVDADILITDYSSVMYDFFYQQKPVIGYMFDRLEWEAQPPGPPHLDYAKDLALDIAQTQEEVIVLISTYLGQQCGMKDEYKRRLSNLFEYRDGKNCERIYKSVSEASRRAL